MATFYKKICQPEEKWVFQAQIKGYYRCMTGNSAPR